MINKLYCYHCFTTKVEEDFICDTCEELYCEECSYTFSLHYQFQGSRCYLCADQSRRNKLTKELIRDNKLLLINKLNLSEIYKINNYVINKYKQ